MKHLLFNSLFFHSHYYTLFKKSNLTPYELIHRYTYTFHEITLGFFDTYDFDHLIWVILI